MSDKHPYQQLSPDLVIEAIESTGLITDLRIMALNSYENRVYQVGIDEAEPLICKFYRPQRWSDEQILEEHQFSFELAAADIPMVPPLNAKALQIANADPEQTLFQHRGFRFSLYRRYGGHAPELDNLDTLHTLGRFMGRIHAVGASKAFTARPALDIQSYAIDNYQYLLEQFIPSDLHTAYRSLAEDLIATMQTIASDYPLHFIRCHGDCHVGNILCRQDILHFVDLDDSRMAPAIQDLWMFLSGDRGQQTRQLDELLDGYYEFHDFDPRELHWIETLRTLRIMNYAGWLARRWDDPAFPHNFPWFNSPRYWSQHILELREQLSLIQQPPLTLQA